MLASCSLAAAAAARQCCWARATHSIAPSSAAGLLEVGKEFEARRQFSAADVAAFAALTGDANPIHTQPAAAHAAGLDACPTPGLLVAALFPAIIGSQLPGSIYLTQQLAFRGTAAVGARLHATVRATRVSGRRAAFDTRCVLEGTDRVVVDGTALALLPAAAR